MLLLLIYYIQRPGNNVCSTVSTHKYLTNGLRMKTGYFDNYNPDILNPDFEVALKIEILK